MTLPPDLAGYQTAYEALPPAERQQVDAALAQSERAMNFLMGQVMQQTQGRANPHVVRAMILERLDAMSTEVST